MNVENMFNNYLYTHLTKKENSDIKPITHTRIGDKEKKIHGGCYHIPKDELSQFYSLYYTHVFENNNEEYLTECQSDGGPLLVDFDFRYDKSVTQRQHDGEFILNNIIPSYLSVIQTCYVFNESTNFNVYVFEKPSINVTDTVTKDGIHILIGISATKLEQWIIRQKIIEEFDKEKIFENLPLTNDLYAIIDESISKGTANWPLFGSRKPGNQAYKITQVINVTFDSSDGAMIIDAMNDVSKFDLKSNFSKLSAQYTMHPTFQKTHTFQDEFNSFKKSVMTGCVIKKPKPKMKTICEFKPIILEEITNEEILNQAVNTMLENLSDDSKRELHEYTQILPELFYNPGSHLLNRTVAFALKKTDDNLFLSWIKLRSKASDFDYRTIPELKNIWDNFGDANSNNKSVTKKTIIFWAKKYNEEKFLEIKKNSISKDVDIAISSESDHDFAKILYKMYKDQYVCVDYKNGGKYYVYKNHKWEEDRGITIRSKLSNELFDMFSHRSENFEKQLTMLNSLPESDENNNKKEDLKKMIKKLSSVKLKLKSASSKNNILKELNELFFDDKFIKRLDTNPYLMGFKNGVVDFENKIFRDGYPDDYITLSTGHDYIPYSEIITKHLSLKREIIHIIKTIFPIKDLYRYIWAHLASILIGVNLSQTFHLYHGSGANGKSVLLDLMGEALGEYKGIFPIAALTNSRTKIGQNTDEFMQIKGKRLAVLQELSKGQSLNEGLFKEIISEKIQARGMYQSCETFTPQCKFVLCTNNLFDIKSNDDGTWRRIRKILCVSKFASKGETYTDRTKFVFEKDTKLFTRFKILAPILLSMLVNKAFKTQGVVKECKTVLQASADYRKQEDVVNRFIKESFVKVNVIDRENTVKKTDVKNEFKAWVELNGIGNKASLITTEEIYSQMNLHFNECTPRGWVYARLRSSLDPNELALDEAQKTSELEYDAFKFTNEDIDDEEIEQDDYDDKT